jgi:hypothetical protein
MSAPSPEAAAAELEALVSSLRAKGRDDAAFCAAHAGVFLLGEKVPESARAFATEYRPARPRRAEAPIDEEAWFKLLAHPDDDPFVSKVFECVLGAVRSVRSVPLARAGLHAQDAAHPTRSSIAVVRALGAAAFALNAPMPLAFLVPARQSAVDALPTDPIASIAGSKVTAGRSLEELAFLAGHHMARYRPAQYIRVLYQDSLNELTALFAASLRAARPQLAVDPKVAKVAEQLRKMLEPAALARLERVVELFVERGAPVDLSRWLEGAERTALRAGLLLCGDLQSVRGVLPLLPSAPSDALSDLVKFAMSDEYWTLRQRLGVALWPDHPVAVEAPLEHVRSSPSIFPPPHELDEAIARAEAAEAVESAASHVRSAAETPADSVIVDIAAPRTSADQSGPHIVLGQEQELEVQSMVFSAPKVPSDLGEVEHPVEAPAPSVPWSAGEDTSVDRPTKVDPQPTITARIESLRASLEALEDDGEKTEIAEWLAALVPALRATYARSPADFDVAQSDESLPFAIALKEASIWLGISSPIVARFDGLGALWSAPPCTPALVLVDPELDRALSALARRRLAAECAAQFAPKRLPLRLAPTPLLLADAVVAVTRALVADGEPDAEGSSTHAIVRSVLGDPLLCEELRPLARRLDATVFRAAALRWTVAAERGAVRQAMALCESDENEDEVFAARPFRAGFLSPDEWRAAVEGARVHDALSAARASFAR